METIGYFNDGVRADWSQLPWYGMLEAAQTLGVNVVMVDGGILGEAFRFSTQKNILYRLVGPQTLDGIIVWESVISHLITPEQRAAFYARYPVPLVLIEGHSDIYPTVANCDYLGMRKVVDHLIESHGFRKFAYIGMHAGHSGFQERWRAFADALTEHGLPINPAWTKKHLEPRTEQNDGLLTMAIRGPWLQQVIDAKVDAIVCVADSIALQVMEAVQQRGLKIPRHIAVTGFDGFRLGQMVDPPLTTVAPDWRDIGRIAMQKVVSQIRHQHGVPMRSVGATLIVSASCGCPDARSTNLDLEFRFRTQEELIAELARHGLATEQTRPILASLLDGTTDPDDSLFIASLEEQLEANLRKQEDFQAWHDFVTLTSAYLDTLPQHTVQAWERKSHKARVLISAFVTRAERLRRFHAELKSWNERELSLLLARIVDCQSLCQLLADKLEPIGFRGWSLVLYDTPRQYELAAEVPAMSVLMGGVRDGQFIALPPQGMSFPTHEVLPRNSDFALEDRNYLLQALYYRDIQIGYMVYEVGPLDGRQYDDLTAAIASALYSAHMVKQLQDQTAELKTNLHMLKETQNKLVASEKMAVLGRLIAGIAHELNTPIGNAIAMASYQAHEFEQLQSKIESGLLRKSELLEFSSTLAKSSTLVQNNLLRAGELIQSLKQVMFEGMEDSLREFHVAQCIKETFQHLKPLFEGTQHTVSIRCPEEFVITSHMAAYSKILSNLCINSLSHGFQPGQAGRIEVAVELEADAWILRYRDNGKGMEKEALGHLFEPFYTSLQNGGSAGLGSYAVFNLTTQLLAGSIEATSAPGEGLAYTFRFPRPTSH